MLKHKAPPISNAISAPQMQVLKRRLCFGNGILLFTAIGATLAIAIGFFFEQHFSLAWQISAHISIILCSITLKIGYLLRSFSLKQLGNNNF
ncbi:MAG: hypothetical protein V7784_08875 [Oceanospirillaceae bacterium]